MTDVELHECGPFGDVYLRHGETIRYISVEEQGASFEQDARREVMGENSGVGRRFRGLPLSDPLAVYIPESAVVMVKRPPRTAAILAYLNTPEVTNVEDGNDGGIGGLLGALLVLAVLGFVLWLV